MSLVNIDIGGIIQSIILKKIPGAKSHIVESRYRGKIETLYCSLRRGINMCCPAPWAFFSFIIAVFFADYISYLPWAA